jgi:hypothetical protein
LAYSLGGNVWDLKTRNRANVEVYLDTPRDGTFLTDQLGHQHFMLKATGLGQQGLTVPAGASRRFTLTFPLAAGLESFKYEIVLLIRSAAFNDERRLRIQAGREIRLADFR